MLTFSVRCPACRYVRCECGLPVCGRAARYLGSAYATTKEEAIEKFCLVA